MSVSSEPVWGEATCCSSRPHYHMYMYWLCTSYCQMSLNITITEHSMRQKIPSILWCFCEGKSPMHLSRVNTRPNCGDTIEGVSWVDRPTLRCISLALVVVSEHWPKLLVCVIRMIIPGTKVCTCSNTAITVGGDCGFMLLLLAASVFCVW